MPWSSLYFLAIIVFFFILVVPFVLSGLFCTYAAYHSRTPLLGNTSLPLSERHCLLRWLLAVPFGLFQGVIVALEIEEFLARSRATNIPRRSSSWRSHDRPWIDKFHCKAVNGAFEGLIAGATILYSFWGIDFPQDNPILVAPDHLGWTHCHWIFGNTLQLTCLLAFLSAGLCLMELDFSVSPRIRKRVRRSRTYEFTHCFFRICEVVSRSALIVGFMVLNVRRLSWFWVPLAVDSILVLFLVDYFGGCEVTMLIRVICAAPCIFADVFRFVDSPYKGRAARNLSKALAIRNLVETVLLPLLCLFNPHFADDTWNLFQQNYVSVSVGLASIPLYWITRGIMGRSKTVFRDSSKDIFTACEHGDMSALMELTTKARVGIDLNIFDIYGKTPLMLVVSRCSPRLDGFTEAEMCRLLIEEGARVNLQMFEDKRVLWNYLSKPMRRRWTALHLAAHRGCLSVVDTLIEGERNYGESYVSETGFGGRYIDCAGDTPLHVAARAGHAEIVNLLLQEWPSWARWMNYRGKTPHDLTSSDEVRQLLQSSSLDELGDTPMMPATRSAPSCSLGMCKSKWQWVRLPIINFSEDVAAGPCQAPGLSSYLASCGGGSLASAFLTNDSTLPRIDEGSIFSYSMRIDGTMSMLYSASTPGGSVLQESFKESFRSLNRSSDVPVPPLGPGLEDIEPIDAQGNVIAKWRTLVDDRARQGSPLGAAAFQLLDQNCILGKGTYGIVWRAQDRHTNEVYAVKNIASPANGGSTADREYEMSNHIRLQPHPCIVTLFQVNCFPDKGFYMIVMEFCPHGDLMRVVGNARRQAVEAGTHYESPTPVPRWIGQVFLALEHLHIRVGAILRDLKPENVVISQHGCAKLTDFGFGRFGAEAAGGGWTFGMPPGSPGYIAPETLLNEGSGFQADLYSYGVLVWVLLTGGVIYDPTPRPPLGKRRSPNDYVAHTNDWLYLQQCLLEPERNGARPCPEDAKQFVGKLTQRRADDRPVHAEMRAYSILQELSLPEAGASREIVEAWMLSGDGSPNSFQVEAGPRRAA